MNILVDTCIWSLALRRAIVQDIPEVRELSELIHEQRVLFLGIVRQEILSGLRDAGSDEYADLVPVYSWVDNLFKSTAILDHLCAATTDIDINSYDKHNLIRIYNEQYNLKSKNTIELMDLIKKAIQPHA